MSNYAIYIIQDSGINGVHTGLGAGVDLSSDIVWPGSSPEDAVQRLQDHYPFYQRASFIVGEVEGTGRPNRMTRVIVGSDGYARRLDLPPTEKPRRA